MIHVYPINDLKDHSLEDTQCDCDPRVIFEYAEIIVVHNSYDGREAFEVFGNN